MKIEQIVNDNMLSYSSYVLTNRCLPDVRDGLKPIHRKILYAMDQSKNKGRILTKSANVTGEVMKYSPHGDCYDTVVNMVQTDKQLHPLIIGKGNFSQHTSRELQAGASRYTEIHLSDVAIEMLNTLDKDMVDFIDNYDGTLKMPEVLPTKYPAILTYANSGIGVGMSSNIPSFNLKEVNEAVINFLKTGKHTTLYPDFATGGYLVNDEQQISLINTTGKGSLSLKAKMEVNKNTITIHEIPYTTTREAIIDKIIALVKDKKLDRVTAVKDLTDITGMKVEITCKKNTDMDKIIQDLYSKTPLQSSFSCEMRMLVDGLPKVMSVEQVIEKWVDFRRQCVVRGLKYEEAKLKKNRHIQEGIIKVIDVIDGVINVIRTSEDDVVIANLMTTYGLTEPQADYLADLKLRYLNKTYLDKQVKDFEQLNKQIDTYEKTLASPKAIDNCIINALNQINKKYAKERKTIIQ